MIEFTSTLLKSVGDPKPARNPAGAGAGAGVTFHPQVWPRAGLGGCRGCGPPTHHETSNRVSPNRITQSEVSLTEMH
jgi:hypothetical protein